MYGSWEKPRKKTKILPKTGTFYLLSFAFYLSLIKTAVSQPVLKFKSSLGCCEIVMFILTSLAPNLNRKDTIENIETPKRFEKSIFC